MAAQYSPLSKELRGAYENFLPSDQKHVINALKDFINKVRDGTDEQRKALGVSWEDDRAKNEISTQLVLDAAHWQLSQLFRVGQDILFFNLFFV